MVGPLSVRGAALLGEVGSILRVNLEGETAALLLLAATWAGRPRHTPGPLDYKSPVPGAPLGKT